MVNGQQHVIQNKRGRRDFSATAPALLYYLRPCRQILINLSMWLNNNPSVPYIPVPYIPLYWAAWRLQNHLSSSQPIGHLYLQQPVWPFSHQRNITGFHRK